MLNSDCGFAGKAGGALSGGFNAPFGVGTAHAGGALYRGPRFPRGYGTALLGGGALTATGCGGAELALAGAGGMDTDCGGACAMTATVVGCDGVALAAADTDGSASLGVCHAVPPYAYLRTIASMARQSSWSAHMPSLFISFQAVLQYLMTSSCLALLPFGGTLSTY